VRGDGAGLTPASFRFQRERGNGGGDDADRWGPMSASGRENRGYRFGAGCAGPRARF
jgi:hypothetical protein